MVIEVRYRDNTVKKLCTDLKRAKREMPTNVAEKLYALINLMESAENLYDIANMQMYHLHPLQGNRAGKYALDIAGRRAGYRLIIVPLDDDGNEWEEKDVNIVYRATRIIIAWEVSNHYE